MPGLTSRSEWTARIQRRQCGDGAVALGIENMAGREKSWSSFSSDPEWQKLRATPGYSDADIVSNITTIFLRPAAYSQI